MSWTWPLKNRIPLLPDEPGLFGFERAEDVHTGDDLYCELGTEVVAVEDGIVIAVQWFTGQHVTTPDGVPATWWNDTKVILIHGASGFVAYGEVSPRVQVGARVTAGQTIAVVDTAVLRSFKGRPMVMLHLELYERLVADEAAPAWAPSHTAWWTKGSPKPGHLLDPTPHLVASLRAFTNRFTHPCSGDFRFDLSAYDGKAFRDPSAPSKPSRWWAVWGGSPE